jgi:putative endonuclease
MNHNSHLLGKEGEERARMHLASKGYRILHSNWRFRRFEVDIIAEHNSTIVFIEVKMRKNDEFGEPEVFVTKQKQGFLISAAHHYLREKEIEMEARFDIISLLRSEGEWNINHIESAFYPRVK